MTESIPLRVEKVRKEIHMVRALYGVSDWEANFLYSIKDTARLSPKQEEILRKIEKKVFEDHEGED